MRKSKTFEIVINLGVFVFALIGVMATAFGTSGMMGGSVILYYTIQSNIWIGGICLVYAILLIAQSNHREIKITKWLHIVKFVFIVAITLTMVVFWLLLAPTLNSPSYLFSLSNLFCHTLTPILALITFFIFDTRHYYLQMPEALYSLLTPVYYLLFVFIMSNLGVTFHTYRVPYFFLDFYEFGWFTRLTYSEVYTFSSFGIFYWILIILTFIFLLGYVLAVFNLLIYRLAHKKQA